MKRELVGVRSRSGTNVSRTKKVWGEGMRRPFRRIGKRDGKMRRRESSEREQTRVFRVD